MKMHRGSYHSGTSGIVLPFPKYKFPEGFEDASRLTYYATLFTSLEVNSSFYKIPQGKTVARWREQVPENFLFTFKLWRGITHVKALAFDEKDVIQFLDAVEYVGDRRGTLLIQFPPGTGVGQVHALHRLLEIIRSYDVDFSWVIAVEFRNSSWYIPEISELLQAYQATRVIHDKGDFLSLNMSDTFGEIYVRFHGPNGNYRESYDDEFLHEYAGYIAPWVKDDKKVYVYFNNTIGSAFDNARILNAYVETNLRSAMSPLSE